MSSEPLPHPQTPGRPGALAWIAALCIAAGLGVSRSALEIPFLYSEVAGIEHNPVATDLATFWERMVTPRGLLERPLSVLSYALNHAVHGADVRGYHLVNIALHALNTLFVVLLAPRLGAAPLWAGAFFSVHPLATACTGQIFGRNYSMATAFCLAALLTLVAWRQRGVPLGPARLVGLVALCAGAFLSKQTLVVFPAVLLWWELCRPAASPAVASAGESAPARLRLVVLAAAAAAFGAVAIQLYAAPLSATATIAPREFALSQLGNLGALVKMYGLPYQTALVHDLPLYDAWRDPQVVLGAACALGAVAAAWRWRRHPAGWLLGALLLCLLPTNTLLPKNEIVREWRLYPSLAFAALLVGQGVAQLRDRAPRGWAVPGLAAVCVWLALLAHATPLQHQHYESRVAAWEHVLARYPQHADSMNNLGTLLYGQGEHERALELFQRAAAAAPRVSLYRMNLARAWAGIGDLGEARRHAGLARELKRTYGERKMAVRYADGRVPTLTPELARALSRPVSDPDATPRRAQAPRRLARLVPRAEFPGGTRFVDLVHEGENGSVRGAPPTVDGELVAERWRELARDAAGLFALRDSLFAQQDHVIEQRAFAPTLPTSWIAAAAEAAAEGGEVRALAIPVSERDAAWTGPPQPGELFGSFPPSAALFRWATADPSALGESLRPRVGHARHALRELAAQTARLAVAAKDGAHAVAAEGAEIVAEQDRRYFGAALRREKLIPLLVVRRAGEVSAAEARVHSAILRRRLADGDAAAARFDPDQPAQLRAAVALARDVLAPGGDSRLWLFVGGSPESEEELRPPSPAAIDALRTAAADAGVDLDRLRFVVRLPERAPTPAERRAAFLQRVEEYPSDDVYLAVEHAASEVFEATLDGDGKPLDFAGP